MQEKASFEGISSVYDRVASSETRRPQFTMARKHPPDSSVKRRSPLRVVGGAKRPSPRRSTRTIGSRPKRMIVMIILLLIASLLMKRTVAPTRMHRGPLSAVRP